MTRLTLPFGLGVLLLAASVRAQPPDQCATCHAELPDARLSAPVVALRDDVHAKQGFTCVDCHGGDPRAADAVVAKSRATGFRGVPRGKGHIDVCARCHADAAFMRKYAPKQRVDQAIEYAVSGHGTRLAAGDTRVATCVSCHGAHGVRTASDAKSPVYPTNVARTCGMCHADSARMTRPDGSSAPVTEHADYETSVHFDALMRRRDLSAPTCNDCHGNHGAAPPGVDAVSNVCGTCHAVFATKLTASPHRSVMGCVECHGNHAIAKPSDTMLGGGEGALCSGCHSAPDDRGRQAAEAMRAGIDRLSRGAARATALVERVKLVGMEVGDQELALTQAHDQLMLARAEIHAFDPKAVDAIIKAGVTITDEVERAGQQAFEELGFRRRGLALSLVVILGMAGALVLKIRQIDRRRAAQAP